MVEQRESKDDISAFNNKQNAIFAPDTLPAHILPALLSTPRLLKTPCVSSSEGKTADGRDKDDSHNLTCVQTTDSDRFHGKTKEGKQEL